MLRCFKEKPGYPSPETEISKGLGRASGSFKCSSLPALPQQVWTGSRQTFCLMTISHVLFRLLFRGMKETSFHCRGQSSNPQPRIVNYSQTPPTTQLSLQLSNLSKAENSDPLPQSQCKLKRRYLALLQNGRPNTKALRAVRESLENRAEWTPQQNYSSCRGVSSALSSC